MTSPDVEALATALESLADWRERFYAQCDRIQDLADQYNVDGDIYVAHDILRLLSDPESPAAATASGSSHYPTPPSGTTTPNETGETK